MNTDLEVAVREMERISTEKYDDLISRLRTTGEPLGIDLELSLNFYLRTYNIYYQEPCDCEECEACRFFLPDDFDQEGKFSL